MRVLAIDDDAVSLALLCNALRAAGYEVETARNGREALEQLRTGQFRLVVSDWEMPEMNGVDLCRHVRARPYAGYIYFILVTARNHRDYVVEGLEAGADDFITKPFEPTELCVRLRAGERILALDSRDLTIFALAKLADSRDPETGAHLERIQEYCRVIARHLSGWERYASVIDGEYIEAIYATSPLHDIGKVGIPDRILNKPAGLTEDEYAVMKTHATIGAEALDLALKGHPEARFLQMARDIAYAHHERYDGTGYPQGLQGDEIPLCARIVALPDVYDALTTKRVYKPAMSHDEARNLIVKGRGTHFDPDVVDAFLATEAMFVAIWRSYADDPPPQPSLREPIAVAESV